MSVSYRLLLVGALALTVAGCPRQGPDGPTGDCRSDEDCSDPDFPICGGNTCVECLSNQQCDCHEVCRDTACQPLGAPPPSGTATRNHNAHGNWEGTPRAGDYRFTGRCRGSDDACDLGDICNPLTDGCVTAAQFQTNCQTNDDCTEAGPFGEVLVCEPSRGKCLPAAACDLSAENVAPDHNCCGIQDNMGIGFVCDSSTQVCRPRESECTPPAQEDITSTCPFLPRVLDTCSAGLFCSPIGKCVQCACDADCGAGLKCYPADATCRPIDFCMDSDECPVNQACDTRSNACRPQCDQGNVSMVCSDTEFCDPDDLVCRPISELPCEHDLWEMNETLATANTTVFDPPPALNTTDTYEGFSLCTTDPLGAAILDQDWFTMALGAGEKIVISGSSPSEILADMKVIAPDMVTELDSGFISPFSGELLEWTANTTGTYYINVEQFDDDEEGFYKLTVSRSQGVACSDPFEISNGIDDLPMNALMVYDFSMPMPPSECALSTTGNTQSVDCGSGVLKLCEGDVDYFAVNVPSGGDLEVILDQFAGDLNLYLYGPYASVMDLDTSRLADSSALIQLTETVTDTARPAGFYLIQVARQSGGVTPYDLEVKVTTASMPCTEDPFDLDPGTAPYTNNMAQISDADGFNDLFVDAATIGLVPGLTEVKTTMSEGLTLCRADVDWFRLADWNMGSMSFDQLPANHRVEIEVVLDTGSPAGVITVAAGTAENMMTFGSTNPANPKTSAFIGRTTGTDDYYVQVQGSPTNPDNLAYSLRVTLVAPPTCDTDSMGDTAMSDNNAPASAFPLDPPTWPSAVGAVDPTTCDPGVCYEKVGNPMSMMDRVTLCPTDDDWYRIDVPTGARVIAWTFNDPTDAEIGLRLYDDSVMGDMMDSGGVPPPTGLLDVSESSGVPYQRVSGSPTGTAYIMVTNRTGWPVLDYQLGVRFINSVCTDDIFDNPPGNDDWENATPIPLVPATYDPQLELGYLDPLAICMSNGEEDWYTVPLFAGDQITASFYYDAQDDLDLYLYEPGPEGLTSSVAIDFDDFESTGVLTVDHTLEADAPVGEYLLRIRPFGPPSSVYYAETLVRRACVEDAFELVPSAPLPAPPYTPPLVRRNLVLCNDTDWFHIPIPMGTQVTACVAFDHAAGDIDFTVYDAVDASGVEPVPTAPPVSFSWSKQDHERVVFTAGMNDTYLNVFLDPRDQVNTTYDLYLRDGNVECPPCPGPMNACNMNGTCGFDMFGAGECTCNPDYFGADCAMECPGGAGNACNGNGMCNDGAAGTGTCMCDLGFSGTDCGICAAGYVGMNCLECPGGAANPCNGNGTCMDNMGTPECMCTSGMPPDCL